MGLLQKKAAFLGHINSGKFGTALCTLCANQGNHKCKPKQNTEVNEVVATLLIYVSETISTTRSRTTKLTRSSRAKRIEELCVTCTNTPAPRNAASPPQALPLAHTGHFRSAPPNYMNIAGYKVHYSQLWAHPARERHISDCSNISNAKTKEEKWKERRKKEVSIGTLLERVKG